MNPVISREYVEKNYIQKQLIEQKIWNDLENLYTLAEKETANEYDNEYYEMLGRYKLAKEIHDYLGEKMGRIIQLVIPV